MTSTRARAYGRVMTLLDELGPAKLHADEQQAVRDAADAVLFTYDIATDSAAKDAIIHLESVMDRLVDGGRLLEETADTILDAVERCGPQTEPLQLPAAA